MMIGTALNLLIITIETICFFMFCDILQKKMKQTRYCQQKD